MAKLSKRQIILIAVARAPDGCVSIDHTLAAGFSVQTTQEVLATNVSDFDIVSYRLALVGLVDETLLRRGKDATTFYLTSQGKEVAVSLTKGDPI